MTERPADERPDEQRSPSARPTCHVLPELQQVLRQFAQDRDWVQFHSPKNLVMALAGEIGELADVFQWLTPEESKEVLSGSRAQDVRDEIADVFAYLLRLADVLDLDLEKALREKIDVNERRYPVSEARGNAKKYTDLS